MKDADHLRRLARRCRTLMERETQPDVVEQLEIWAIELAELTEDLECRLVRHETAEPMVSA